MSWVCSTRTRFRQLPAKCRSLLTGRTQVNAQLRRVNLGHHRLQVPSGLQVLVVLAFAAGLAGGGVAGSGFLVVGTFAGAGVAGAIRLMSARQVTFHLRWLAGL